MKRQAFQTGEIRDENGSIIQLGAYGKNSAFVTADNQGILDYIINNLQALYDMILASAVYVDSKEDLPMTGDANKLYITKDTGKTYRWNGDAYQEATSAINGLSAYELAKAHGFPGTEVEWLDGQLNRDIVGPSPANMANAHVIVCAGPKAMRGGEEKWLKEECSTLLELRRIG